MQAAEIELKAQIAALVQKAANTDETEKNEPALAQYWIGRVAQYSIGADIRE